MNWKNKYTLSSYSKKNYKIFTIVCFLVFALIIDTLIVSVPDFLQDRIVSSPGIALFIMIAASYVAGQYFILHFIKQKTKDIRSKSIQLNTTHLVVTAVQYTLIAIFGLVILEILITNQYHITSLIAATLISYALNVVLLILFAKRLLHWYRSNRNSIVIILYSISALAFAFSSAVALVADYRNLIVKEETLIKPQSPIIFPSFDPGSLASLLSDIYRHSNMVATLLVWSTTVLLLYHYFDRLNKLAKVRFWILISLPLIYYLSAILVNFDLYVPQTDTEAFYYYAFLSLNATAAGILFGLAFRTVAKSIRPNSAVRDYIIISAYGFVLLFIANQATLTPTPYPPFGLAAVSTVGLAAYLIYIGVYSAGISMSEDINLRQTIRKSAIEEAKLLVSIGSAQIQQQLEKKVLQGAKERANKMASQTGVQVSLTDADMKQYLNSVLKEIKVIRDVDQIVKKGKEILETSFEFMACLRYSGIRLAYNNYFDVYEKIIDKSRRGDHDGIRIVTSINKDSVDLIRAFLDKGIDVRHVKNLPPIDFSLSDKEIVATIQKSDYDETSQNLLVSNEAAYLDHFVSIFEELWKSGIEAQSRINAIEEGVDSEGIEIIQNPVEIQNLGYNLVKSANDEILVIFASSRSPHAEEEKTKVAGLIQLLKEAITQRGVKVRIVAPKDDFIEESLKRLLPVVEEMKEQKGQQLDQKEELVTIRYVEPQLQTKVSVIVVDRKFSLAVEQKEETRHGSVYGVVGLATYSNSKATVLSYASIFETLWKQTEMYEQLKIHDRMQKEFINIAAHELRNPIQPLVLSSESLKGSMPDEERVSIVIRNAKKLQTLANEILDITKIESKTLKLNKEIVNVNEIIVYGMKDLLSHPVIAEGKVNLVYEPGKEDIFVQADRDRLGQVISNLLNNSIKFTEEGSISITVQKSVETDEVVVSIKDTGRGIDSEILPRLFSKFVTKSDTGGTGLGLFISKSIVEAHGGRIWAENNQGEKGATFTFSLPASSSSIPLQPHLSTPTVPTKVNQG
jgi:nitrogen-specific signal transduction histidine kinase